MAKKNVINKLAGINRTTEDHEAAKSVVQMESDREKEKAGEQRQRELLIAQSHEMAGQIKAATMFSKFGDVSRLVWLKQVKDAKAYKAIGTWDYYCEYLGLDRRTVDEELQNLRTFGEDFLATVAKMSVGYRELRKLRQLTSDGDVTIETDCVTIGEEKIPFSPDHSEDLQVAIESLLESKSRDIEDKDATIRAKDKLLADKEKMLNRQEKELAKLEGKAKTNGMSAEEQAFIQQCDNARITIEGFLNQFDPDLNPLPENHTARMKAAYMETLGYFRRTIAASYDTASDIYGDPDLDDDWIPPHQRTESTAPEA